MVEVVDVVGNEKSKRAGVVGSDRARYIEARELCRVAKHYPEELRQQIRSPLHRYLVRLANQSFGARRYDLAAWAFGESLRRGALPPRLLAKWFVSRLRPV